MNAEDDTVIMPGRPGGEGGEPPEGRPPEGPSARGPGGPGSGGGSSRREKIIMISAIAAIFVVAALIVIIIRACGGDEPAPSTTPTQTTVTKTVTETATVSDTTPTDSDGPAGAGDIYSVDWKDVVGARPMVRDVEEVFYNDFTNDGEDEALILVRLEGSGAYLDYYVYAYDEGALTPLFEKLGVDHGQVELGSLPGSFVETSPVYAPGDPNCCPSQLKYTTYTWSASAKVFVETTVEVVDNPDV